MAKEERPGKEKACRGRDSVLQQLMLRSWEEKRCSRIVTRTLELLVWKSDNRKSTPPHTHTLKVLLSDV